MRSTPACVCPPALPRRYPSAQCRCACRNDLATFDPLINGRRPTDQDIERFAGVGASQERGRQVGRDIEAVARRALELRADLGEQGRDRPGRPDSDLGGVCNNRLSKNARELRRRSWK
jgi:hypothetical protein